MNKHWLISLPLICWVGWQTQLWVNDPIDDIKQIAKQFVNTPRPWYRMCTWIRNSFPLRSPDFIQMAADKKIGGKPRKIEFRGASLLPGEIAGVRVRAINEEYIYCHPIVPEEPAEWASIGVVGPLPNTVDGLVDMDPGAFVQRDESEVKSGPPAVVPG